ncbi:methionine adenosyltransferase [Sandaracinobacteroides sp. A072]|uniref:methionine adenosyltransferase n=1 Tax=Sandaracinobacteroides sp. A072 TaxID=3461146 RepID=UPI0040434066
MARSNFIFTSESVSEGHPDKVADQISDAVVDLFLARSPEARVACETMVTTNRIILAGEKNARGGAEPTDAEIEAVAREAVKRIGYAQKGFHWKDASFDNFMHQQSADIAVGVDEAAGKDEGAGDQGIMFGYATDETDALMPATLHYSHLILKRLAELRHSGEAPFLEPDAKSQVTLAYEREKPVRAVKLVVSTQHAEGHDQAKLRSFVKDVMAEVLPDGWMPKDEDAIFVNPTGVFVTGGPDGDAGLTGRKIIVDSYGGAAPHGGGAFSGKDPTKVDRSAAYMARYLAKNIVAAGLARRCTLQLSYAIGVAEPLSLHVDLHGTGLGVTEDRLEQVIPELVGLTPKKIRLHLGLNRPIYLRTAAYGHFGRAPDADGGFSWERTDLAEALKAAV